MWSPVIRIPILLEVLCPYPYICYIVQEYSRIVDAARPPINTINNSPNEFNSFKQAIRAIAEQLKFEVTY